MAPVQGLCRYGLEVFKKNIQSNKTIEEPHYFSLVEYALNLCLVLVKEEDADHKLVTPERILKPHLSREHVDQSFRDLHNGTCSMHA